MDLYREELINNLKILSHSENMSDRETFFLMYCEKLEESELIEDYHYLYFLGKGRKNKNIQVDGYSYNELDQKLVLFVIPPLSYFENKTLTRSEADNYFNRAKYFFSDAQKIIDGAEESSEGFGLAYDIINGKNMKISRIEIVILTDYVKSDKIRMIESTIENGVRIDYTIYDLARMKAIDQSESGKEKLIINLVSDFEIEGIPILPASETKDYQAYLCNIPGELLARMYDRYQSKLLEGNVRSFLQTRGKVNKGIRDTILNHPEMFFAYNNGIAATAEKVEIKKDGQGFLLTELTALQIVNGGQTTASLANAWVNDTNRNSREQIKKIWVPMKISVVKDEVSEELIPNISRFANSQNKVSDADLASNHPFHREIESLSRKIIAPAVEGAQYGTYWYYERANGQYRQETYKSTKSNKKNFETQNPKKQMFKKVELAKYHNIYLQRPDIASAGAQKSFNKFSEWMIKQWDKDPNIFNDEFYKKTISLAILFKTSDYIVRRQEWYDSYKANIVAYTLSLIFYNVEKYFPNKVIDFQIIWKKQKLSDAWIKQIIYVSKIVYEQHLLNPNRTVENVTEWAKREISWKQAKEIDYELNDQFINELLDKDYIITIENSAKKEKKQKNEINALLKVYEYGATFWKEVYEFGIDQNIWNIQDLDFLKIAMNIDSGKVPSDKQSLRILRILEKARTESFPK